MISKINLNFNLKQINTQKARQNYATLNVEQTHGVTDTFTSTSKVNFSASGKYQKWKKLVSEDALLQQYIEDISKYEPLKDAKIRKQLFNEFLQAKKLKNDALQELLESNIKTVVTGKKKQKNIFEGLNSRGYDREFAIDDIIRANAKLLLKDEKEQEKLYYLISNAGNFTDIILPKIIKKHQHLVSIAPDKLNQLFEQIDKSDKIINEIRPKLIEGNLRLVPLVAMKFINYTNVPMKDIVQAGNLGLIKAVDTCKDGYNTEFSSYACKLITYSILKELTNSSGLIRIPDNILHELKSIETAENTFEEKYLRTPTLSELAKEMGIKVSELQYLKKFKAMNDELQNVEDIAYNKKWTTNSQETTSNYAVTDDDLLLVRDIIPQDESLSVTDITEQNSLKQAVFDILSTLTSRESDVINKRFALEEGNEMSLEEIAAKYNVTRERIRQIESKALRKLRHPVRGKYLYEFR